MEKDYSLTEQEKKYITSLEQMTEEEQKLFLLNHNSLYENKGEIPYVDMSIEEFCAKYGYVDLDEVLNNLE